MVSLSDLCIDIKKQFGNVFWLADVLPDKPFGQQEVVGYKYHIMAVERKMLSLMVKIPGAMLINPPEENGYVTVEFENLEVRPYVGEVSNKADNKKPFVKAAFSATAKTIKAVNNPGKPLKIANQQ